jgi:hypothetical protein
VSAGLLIAFTAATVAASMAQKTVTLDAVAVDTAKPTLALAAPIDPKHDGATANIAVLLQDGRQIAASLRISGQCINVESTSSEGVVEKRSICYDPKNSWAYDGNRELKTFNP